MEKIKSGIYGLNPLLDGGINKNSTSVVIGPSGAGKTTFATQFLRKGLEEMNPGVFISLDENREQIINEAVEMGWTNIYRFLDEKLLLFIDASGKKFAQFIREDLPDFIQKWEGANARIVIDPLTPVMWAVKDRYEQRELLSFLLKETRRIGTVVCTLEEHGSEPNLSGSEVIIPMYLADCVIHLRYDVLSDTEKRKLKIIKCRSSRHSKFLHDYKIIRGLGLMLKQHPLEIKGTTDIPKKLKKELEKKLKLPKRDYNQFMKNLDYLIDDDFTGLEYKEVANNIIRELGDKDK
jgi:KaiC/GvpD/RAD55 family RecA-like ATPase